MKTCQKMIENGTVGFACRVRFERQGEHLGPCAAPERQETMRKRAEYLASIGHPTIDVLEDPDGVIQVATSSLAAHVASDHRVEGEAPVDPNEPCSFCLGVSSEMCPECRGTGLANGAIPGPFFFVHSGMGKALEAYVSEGDGYSLVATLDWHIDGGQVQFDQYRNKLQGESGDQLGKVMVDFLQGRAKEAMLGVAYDGRDAPPSEESLAAMPEVADRPTTQRDPQIVAHETGAHQGAPKEDCAACRAESQPDPAVQPPAEGLKLREGDQPLPETNDHPAIQPLVIADIERRMEVGVQRYGTLLQPENGRDMARDAYEEALDLVVYHRGALEEKALVRALLGELLGLVEGVFPPQGVAPTSDPNAVERIFAIIDQLQRLHPAPE